MDGKGAEEIPQWNIYMEGSSNRQPGGVGVVLISLEEDRIECMIRLEFHTTNNEAEYGIPRVLVPDNGKQFDNSAFRDFCSELGIKNHYSSPAHPQANGQVEVTNQSLLKIIKNRLEGAKGIWPEELLSILWAF
ncbi:uncharacterized protein LOC115964608 [Quercus lobata]|uniref:uncharacterized protein LOC115964608 n=1 Tax=Quercus lobata TaxID=97700 RepID=UPI001247B934|nr:uncharacterized protein LOC115964608 [Quercus lobata]